jgi:hypothetical protein
MIISVDGTGDVRQYGLLMDEHGYNEAPSLRPTTKRKRERQNSEKEKASANASSGKSFSTPPASAKLIQLAKQRPSKPIVKSPMFMTSPSSIYMAICEYNSLIDALYGGISLRTRGSGQSGEDIETCQCDVDLNFLHRTPTAGDCESELEYSLIMINIYFGGCTVFEQKFDTTLSKSAGTDNKDRHSKSLSPANFIEKAFHQSVRHLCSQECFLRAYHPIREFCLLWRDVKMIDCSGKRNVSLSLKKDKILSGWRCRQYPRTSTSASLESRHTVKKSNRSSPLIYISPDGMEFNTKTKAINYMNTLLSTQRPSSTTKLTASTLMIDVVTSINPLYSPLGLLEELFVHDPWKLLVSTICLNVTTRTQVDKVLHNFFQRWPDVHSTASETNWEDISRVISPLGLGIKRAKGLIRFSREYLFLTVNNDPFSLTESQVKSLHNIGQYGWAAYELFILQKLPLGSVKVCDHALQLYVEYQLGRRALECRESLTNERSDVL